MARLRGVTAYGSAGAGCKKRGGRAFGQTPPREDEPRTGACLQAVPCARKDAGQGAREAHRAWPRLFCRPWLCSIWCSRHGRVGDHLRLLAECGRPKIVINTNYESFRLDFRCWGADAFVVQVLGPQRAQSDGEAGALGDAGRGGARVAQLNSRALSEKTPSLGAPGFIGGDAWRGCCSSTGRR